jgi:hypothetical protein
MINEFIDMKRLTAASEAKPDLSNAESETLPSESDPLWATKHCAEVSSGHKSGAKSMRIFDVH